MSENDSEPLTSFQVFRQLGKENLLSSKSLSPDSYFPQDLKHQNITDDNALQINQNPVNQLQNQQQQNLTSILKESLGIAEGDNSMGTSYDNRALSINLQGDDDEVNSLRKVSQADSEINVDELLEIDEEYDIRRKINQKLIRNQNYFKHFIGASNKAIDDSNSLEESQMHQLIDKRSRSETPDKMSATEVLLRAHQKLAAAQAKRRESPHKILEKHQLRQKKAEELRSQIEQTKKKWYEKTRIRQQIAKDRWKEFLAERKAKLQDKLDQAEERRESEIQTTINKAKQEIQKIDETNYIMKMTMNNMKLDLNLKMNETQERRNQIMEEYKRKKQQDRTLKEEAAEKRRQELQKSTESKFLTNQQKREQAEMRRNKMIEEKKKAAHEAQKRSMVLQRKNDIGFKLSDVMSFVNSSECIWDFLGNERDWQELGAFSNNRIDDLFFELLHKDHLEIEKLKLKKDAELLNKIIFINQDGEIFSNKEYLPQAMKKFENFEQSSDSDSDSGSAMDKDQENIMTPEKIRKSLLQLKSQQNEEESKSNNGYNSDGSEKESIPEEKDSQDDNQSLIQQQAQQLIFSEEVQNHLLYSSRLKMSMKRNILKKNLSEDLTWADFLKNEIYQQQMYPQTFRSYAQTRSMHSTPERKQDIASESENTVAQENLHEEEEKVRNNKSKKKRKKKQKNNKSKAKSIKQQQQQQQNPNNNNNNTSSSGNLSEKSRISSVVYPSQKKKNPLNCIQSQQPSEIKLGAFDNTSQKKISSGSNQSSTHSLLISNSFVEVNTQTAMISANRKSFQIESDSARKRQYSRLNSSSLYEQASANPSNLNIQEDQQVESQSQMSFTHTGSQMSSLITNTKPALMPPSKLPKKLTSNANKMLFPIRDQKLLLKRPGKEGQFGTFKVSVKMEDLLNIQKTINLTSLTLNSTFTETSNDDKIPIQKSVLNSSNIQNQQSNNNDNSSTKKSNQNTPSQTKRRESFDVQHSNSSLTNISSSGQNNNIISTEQVPPSTPSQNSTSRLLQIQQKFQEKYAQITASNQQQIQNSLEDSKKQQQSNPNTTQNSLASESSLSPPPKIREIKPLNNEIAQLAPVQITLNQILPTTTANPSPSVDQNLVLNMNEQGIKELLVKFLLVDYFYMLKTEDSQKTIAMEGPESEKLIDYLEQFECQLRFCRLCDLIIPEHLTNEAHTQLKSHKKTREELLIKETEDLQLSILTIISQPGDIEKELIKEKEKALKRKVKRVKAQMIAQAISHESASTCPGKEYLYTNKRGFQIICLELEKQVIPIINNYEALENTLKEIIKILDKRKQADLHLMRKLKFIPILIEICKRISVCHKNELKLLGRLLEYVIKIINVFCGLRENRNYMLQTNRMLALIELLNWCLNRPTQLFYGINFMPTLFHILTLHVKHRVPYECQEMKEMFIEYLISSQLTAKIKSKFQIINGPLELSEMMGQVSLFLLKSAAFIEALTNLLQIDSIVRPVYEKSSKIGEHVLFVIANTELFGIIPMITTILLSRNYQNKAISSSNSTALMPQTLLSLAITSIKIMNNVLRMDYRAAQQMMSDYEIQEQLYHLFNYLLQYTVETGADQQQQDSTELLHETILLIGYFTLFNEKNQQLLCRGENTLLQKLCKLPVYYFFEKKNKEILLPTLIMASYKNERSLAIMDQEISIEMIVDFIQLNLKEELPKIVEEMDDQYSLSSLGQVDRRTRSPSQSSTSSQQSMQFDAGNSPYLPLYMRFPKKHWKEALAFYSSVLY